MLICAQIDSWQGTEPKIYGYAPVNLAIFLTWIITLVRRSGIPTVPQALRLWANQVDDVFFFSCMKPP